MGTKLHLCPNNSIFGRKNMKNLHPYARKTPQKTTTRLQTTNRSDRCHIIVCGKLGCYLLLKKKPFLMKKCHFSANVPPDAIVILTCNTSTLFSLIFQNHTQTLMGLILGLWFFDDTIPLFEYVT